MHHSISFFLFVLWAFSYPVWTVHRIRVHCIVRNKIKDREMFSKCDRAKILHSPMSSSCSNELLHQHIDSMFGMWVSAKDGLFPFASFFLMHWKLRVQCQKAALSLLTQTWAAAAEKKQKHRQQIIFCKNFRHFPKTMELNAYFCVRF